MNKNNIVKCTAMIVAGIIAIVAMLTDPANGILAIGLFAIIVFVLCM